MERIILASASPRRKELLTQIGINFEVIPSAADESSMEKRPDKLVEDLSHKKAVDVMEKVTGDGIIIGADTIVAKDSLILGKPKNEQEAFEMLSLLQGSTHQVYSGVTLLVCRNGNTITETFHVKTEVEVLPMTREEIQAYISLGSCLDKAGSYGIQECFARHIKGICGDYNNVVGLPVSELYMHLKKYDIL